MSRFVPLSRGYVAIVDDADYELVVSAGPWHAHGSGRLIYPQRHVKRPCGKKTSQYMHQFLTGWSGTDHISMDGLDNRRENLRPATRSQNNANRQPQHNGTSGFKGVTWDKSSGRWKAQIQVGGRNRHLGRFSTAEAAAQAYDAAAIAAWGEYARTNLVGSVHP